MKRVIVILVLTIAFILFLSFSIFAENSSLRLNDECGFLNDAEYSYLISYLESKSNTDNCDYVVVFLNSLPDSYGNDIESFADDYFDYNGFGRGNSGDDGILLLVVSDLGSGGRYISTCGRVIDAINENDIYEIGSAIKSNGLLDGDYVKAVTTFVDEASNLIYLYDSGYYNSSDSSSHNKSSLEKIGVISLMSVLPSIIIAAVTTGSMKNKLQTVSLAKEADLYVDTDSLNLSVSNDTFLYSNTSRIRISSDNGTRSSGGSYHSSGSSHRSSSGRSHGGGRF